MEGRREEPDDGLIAASKLLSRIYEVNEWVDREYQVIKVQIDIQYFSMLCQARSLRHPCDIAALTHQMQSSASLLFQKDD